MRALYVGKCPACGDTINRGDPLVKAEGQWVHEDCQDVVSGDRGTTRGDPESKPGEPIKAGEKRCDRCFTYHPGEC